VLKKGLIWLLFTLVAGFALYVLWIAPSMPVQDTVPSETDAAGRRQGVEKTEKRRSQSEAIGPAVLSPDGRSALVVLGDRIALCDLVSGRVQKTFASHLRGVTSLAVSPDGNTVLSGSDDGVVRLWNIENGREVGTFRGHTDAVTSVAFSPDGRLALSAGLEGSTRLWDIASGRKVRTFAGAGSESNTAALFAPDGRSILSEACSKKGLALWDPGNGQPVRDFGSGSDYSCRSAFSPDGRSVMVGSFSSGVRLLDVASGRGLRMFDVSSYWQEGKPIAFSPDGRSVVWGGVGGTVRLWDVSGANTLWGQIVWAITPAARPRIFVGQHSEQEKSLKLAWSGHSLMSFMGLFGDVNSVAFTADGRRIMAAGGRSLTLWDVATGEVLVTLRLFTDDSWLVVTQEGFYDSSVPQDVHALRNLVGIKGLTRCSDAEIEQALHRPDLVAEKLSGDGAGKVRAAEAAFDLEKACPGGPR